jgi:proteasome lid subunit RPN8/RPN11
VVRISKEIVEEMVNHAREEFPRECCGMLAGNNTTITKLFKIKNIAQRMDEYELDPLEQVNAFEEIDRLSLNLLGVYHSHPNHPCYPSGLDISQAFYPDTLFFIISLSGSHQPHIRSFKMHAGKVSEEEMIVD